MEIYIWDSPLFLVLELCQVAGRGQMVRSCRITKISPPTPLLLFPVILVTDEGPHILCLGRPRIAQQQPRECAVWLQSLPCP